MGICRFFTVPKKEKYRFNQTTLIGRFDVYSISLSIPYTALRMIRAIPPINSSQTTGAMGALISSNLSMLAIGPETRMLWILQ